MDKLEYRTVDRAPAFNFSMHKETSTMAETVQTSVSNKWVLAMQSFKDTASNYYKLTKPGIVYSNVMTAAAGYLFASHWHVHIIAAAALLIGTALVIASACVFNNYIDRHIDAKMRRTQKRALVTGRITSSAALRYGAVLGIIGFLVLSQTNTLTTTIGITTFISYVIIYGLAKRRSIHGTLMGTIPGAASLIAGYTAIAARLDITTLVLFAIMVTWQMAHFYAISIFCEADYRAAGIPVRPVVKGITNTKIHIVFYVIAYTLIAPSLALAGGVGYIYALVMFIAGLLWTRVSLKGLFISNSTKWARKTFGYSLAVLLIFCTVLSLGTLVP
jgi:protoheme IX farnesyltransferase